MFHHLFPDLKAITTKYYGTPRRFGAVNLDLVALERMEDPLLQGPPFFATPKEQAKVVAKAEGLNLSYSYGGWMEDRQHFLRDTYLSEQGCYLHLGVDFNVPPGTRIQAPQPMTVEVVSHDPDQNGGWGGRIVTRMDDGMVLIFAHLGDLMGFEPGERIVGGDMLGLVGDSEKNGGWWPHLHVQCVDPDYYAKTSLDKIDGYAKTKDRELMMRLYPDPLPVLFL